MKKAYQETRLDRFLAIAVLILSVLYYWAIILAICSAGRMRHWFYGISAWNDYEWHFAFPIALIMVMTQQILILLRNRSLLLIVIFFTGVSLILASRYGIRQNMAVIVPTFILQMTALGILFFRRLRHDQL